MSVFQRFERERGQRQRQGTRQSLVSVQPKRSHARERCQQFRQGTRKPVVGQIEREHPPQRIGGHAVPFAHRHVIEPAVGASPFASPGALVERNERFPVVLVAYGSERNVKPLQPPNEIGFVGNTWVFVVPEVEKPEPFESREGGGNQTGQVVSLDTEPREIGQTAQLGRNLAGKEIVVQPQVLQPGQVGQFGRNFPDQAVHVKAQTPEVQQPGQFSGNRPPQPIPLEMQGLKV